MVRNDGKVSDVYTNDELYPLLGEPIAPSILIVPALTISTSKQIYVFYGNRIQLDNVDNAYIHLRECMGLFKQNNSVKEVSKLGMPKLVKRILNTDKPAALPKEESLELSTELTRKEDE